MNPNNLSIDMIQEALGKQRYICDRSLATVVFLAVNLSKPVLLEGEAGVGKTEIAKVLSEVMGAKLIRLQCYEGLELLCVIALAIWVAVVQIKRISGLLNIQNKNGMIAMF